MVVYGDGAVEGGEGVWIVVLLFTDLFVYFGVRLALHE